MKQHLSRLGGQLGVGLCVAGFILVFLGWNGAASRDRVPAQFPYLISGGIAGLCLVVLGVGMIVVQNQRADRVALQGSIDRLRETVERKGVATTNGHQASQDTSGTVVAGRSSYHRPDCHLARDRDAELLTPDEATARGLDPCRICNPQTAGPQPATPEAPRRQLRAN